MQQYQLKLRNMIEERNKLISNEEYFHKYLQVRMLHSFVMNNLVEYADKHNKQIFKKLSNLLVSRRETSNTNNLIGMEIEGEEYGRLITLICYPVNSEYESVSELFFKESRYKSLEEKEILRAIIQSSFGIFKLIKNDFEKAKLVVENMITNEQIEIIDMQLGCSMKMADIDDLIIVGRIVTYDGINFLDGGIVLNGDKNLETYNDIMNLIMKAKLGNRDSLDLYFSALVIQKK